MARRRSAAAAQAVPMVRKLGFALEIEVADEIDPDLSELLQAIPDALWAYDAINRLFPGKALPARGERLLGTSISLDRSSIERDFRATVGTWKEPPTWPKSEDARHRAIDLNGAFHAAIERLREVQAKLNEAYDAVAVAKTEEELNVALPSLEREIKRAGSIAADFPAAKAKSGKP
jgi:hypothetical protein